MEITEVQPQTKIKIQWRNKATGLFVLDKPAIITGDVVLNIGILKWLDRNCNDYILYFEILND